MNKKELYDLEKKQNILLCAKLFLENDYYIIDIANIIKQSTSTVQRYLNDPYIEIKLGKDIKELIELKLKAKKTEGNLKGGIISTINNEATKDSNGKFTGMKRR